MRKTYILSSFLGAFLLLLSSSYLSADSGSCVNCHTNEGVMKALYKAPAMPEGEGEG